MLDLRFALLGNRIELGTGMLVIGLHKALVGLDEQATDEVKSIVTTHI